MIRISVTMRPLLLLVLLFTLPAVAGGGQDDRFERLRRSGGMPARDVASDAGTMCGKPCARFARSRQAQYLNKYCSFVKNARFVRR